MSTIRDWSTEIGALRRTDTRGRSKDMEQTGERGVTNPSRPTDRQRFPGEICPWGEHEDLVGVLDRTSSQ